jgi:hypothetical protein
LEQRLGVEAHGRFQMRAFWPMVMFAPFPPVDLTIMGRRTRKGMTRLLLICTLLAAGPAMAQTAGDDMAGMPGMAGMSGMDHAAMNDAGMAGMPAGGLLGAYPMTREASGTSWQPDASTHEGVHSMAGGWMLMSHATLNGVVDSQGGARGDDKAFVAGMAMVSARRPLGGGVFGLRAMLAPDPLMGKSGYPLLLAAGETADGRTPLVDRQHPHDLFMELAATYSRPAGEHDSWFAYAGLPGEPAFGPPAFMHRSSGMDSPEAPITHHWLDSTHVSFGVLTAGWVHDGWKLEGSRFRGREPDQERYDIEAPKLDSSAVRLSWNPGPHWSLQTSWAQIASPEALEPDVDETRWSASAIYARPVGRAGLWSTTAAFGRKRRTGGETSDAWLLESALKPDAAWTLFARAERLQTDELAGLGTGLHGPLETVSKLSVGAVRDWRVATHAKVGLGALATANDIPMGLRRAYGDSPKGAMAFVRLVID